MAADGSLKENANREDLQPKKALSDNIAMYRQFLSTFLRVSLYTSIINSNAFPLGLIAEEWKERFEQTLNNTNTPLDLSPALTEDCVWRDLMVFTPDFRCLTPRSAIEEQFSGPVRAVNLVNLRLLPNMRPQQLSPTHIMIQGLLAFDTSVAHCIGVYTLQQGRDRLWKAWALVTAVDSLIGIPGRYRSWCQQDKMTMSAGPKSTSDVLNHQPNKSMDAKSSYTVVIIGAGQSGLGLAAQLENVGIDVFIIEKAERAGDSWASRYESLKLNTPKSFCMYIIRFCIHLVTTNIIASKIRSFAFCAISK
jgi:putative flavoprotein involved in K+ transport